MESDEETNEIEADWSSNVNPDILRDLSVGEKKRQEIINGMLSKCVISQIEY